ncbi:MAG: GNAT family N-acetyltransferase [Telmatospirillum sp.]|nr:GNAT family N-acetyltransferase [Telmatospirillum sp.]
MSRNAIATPVIRRGADPDIPLLATIEKSADERFRDWPGLEWIATAGDVFPARRLRDLVRTGLVLVADAGGCDGLVGFLAGEAREGCLHLWQIAVLSPWQGQGIGSRLLAGAGHFAISQGLATLTLTTFRSVPWNEPWYRGRGFATLAETEMPPHLRTLLREEGEGGLPVPLRCAMTLILTGADRPPSTGAHDPLAGPDVGPPASDGAHSSRADPRRPETGPV